ncbi:efflux RND transporter periplasmic adaptor subunit [Parasedimentitalea psychrophila]|uniref:HlyD family efflux transporter periplasmic adaptor subunit n=1 Tax=Parasedimentitalea psychrophila TaxID=2997337 RepID=A0A9Y2L256_9RHOB|nr:HlyD family efflux transporter periplasmic adaptor subunit [Parasedimentitalea psychrophila]WIY26286.1 HlyD family efflux transporter periplasmic adaptor subunit [Parasedimentitalea psychrophila]
MRFLRQSLAGLFLAAVSAALLLYAGQLVLGAVQQRMSDERRAPPHRERVFAVNLVTADLQDIAPKLIAFGKVESRRRLELRTPVAGRVIALAEDFEEGGVVTAGQLLLQIDPADAQSALERAEADMQDARAEQRETGRTLILAQDELSATQDQAQLRQRAYQRQIDLKERGVGTAATVEVAELAAVQARQSVISRRQAVSLAEAGVDQAGSSLARAQISLATARRDLADTTVMAQFDGTLQSVSLVQGRLVSANEKLAELVDPTMLEVAFRISTVQYTRLLDASGGLIAAPVRVSLDATGADLSADGVISRDSGGAGAGQSGRLIYARLNAAPGFKPGDFVTVSVREPELSAVARLPASVLDANGTVLVLGPEDRLEQMQVELVRRQGDDVLIRGPGLAGREVVVGRTPLLGAGIKVRALRTGAALQPQPQAELIELSDERRARLTAIVEGNSRMPEAAKKRVLQQLAEAKVPAKLVTRIETRMGG